MRQQSHSSTGNKELPKEVLTTVSTEKDARGDKRVTAKKENQPPKAVTKAAAVAVQESGPATVQDALDAAIPQIQEALKNISPEKLEAARKEAEKLLTGDMSWADLTLYTPEKRMQMAEMGFNQFRLGQYDSAEKIFKGLTIIDPENFYFHQMLGATFQRKEKLAEAILEYSIAFDLNPKDIVSVTNRGEIYFKLGIFELANVDFDAAIALDPKNDDKWANRARMLREQARLMRQARQ